MDEALLPPVEKPKTFLEIYLFHNFSTKKSRKFFYLKCFLLILLLLLIFSSQAINSSTSRSPKCIEDRIFNLTSSINSYFSSSPSIKNSFVILSSFFLDLNISIFLGIFLLWGDSWREVIFAGSFYSTRGLLQALTILGFPEGFIWEYPGIYSLLITYVRSSDFFYSGHVGMMMFTGIYYYRNHFLGLMWYSVFCCIFEAIVMVLVRCHYSIDIVGALIFCHYFWILSKDFAFYADVLGFRQAREAKGELIGY